MNKHGFEEKVRAVEALRTSSDAASRAGAVRKVLRDRSNYLVSKAAAVAGDLRLIDLIPDLIAAFDRFLRDPVKTDPKCWAKNAIAKALKELEHREPEVFLRGIRHIQLEPVYGGHVDSAVTVRGTCAQALVQCSLSVLEFLKHLGDRLADPEKPVRVDAALAIGQLGSPEGAPLLRLKALLGDRESEVTGQCFASLLALAPEDSVPFVVQFLDQENEDTRLEAACALAASREPRAFEALRRFWAARLPTEFRRTVVSFLGASPLKEAAEFLLSMIETDAADLAEAAIRALGVSRFRNELRGAAEAAIASKSDAALRASFERAYRVGNA
jgi:HEAT repeat protein